MTYYVYIIVNPAGRTYIGYTVNPKRRLRQHCGILVGGARATKCSTEWTFLLIMTCYTWTASRAMQVEWLVKHPQRKKKILSSFRGIDGRIFSLKEICSRVDNDNINIFIRDDLLSKANELDLPENITILPICELAL